MNKKFIAEDQYDFRQLPSNVATYTQRLVHESWKSFFALNKKYKNGELELKPGLPKYLHKTNGRQVAVFTKRVISYKRLRDGFLKLCGIAHQMEVPKDLKINQVRIVPKINGIVLEIVHTIKEPKLKKTGKIASGDLGIDNLIAVGGTEGMKPALFNGKPLKSINQYYNKKKAELQSKIPSRSKRKQSKKIAVLTEKRNHKVKDYLHKISSMVVNYLVSNNVKRFVVGYNKRWKQGINIGKVNNQKFVSIPYLMFVNMLRYKCAMVGIKVETVNESYTSKCSFLDNEPMCKHKTYMGRRVHRGLFKSSTGQLINADINAAYNILRKVIGKFNYNPIEVCGTPTVFTVKSSPRRRKKSLYFC